MDIKSLLYSQLFHEADVDTVGSFDGKPKGS